jgi:hypothetical protein
MSIVELRLGDMFDGPSDLIVLPCSTVGSVTPFVREKLRNYRIPYPKPVMNLGDVQVHPFEGGENIAQFVAYAVSVEASVEGTSTTEEAIRRIGGQLGDLTIQNASVRQIAAPLLGAGAGGLRSETAVSCLHKDVFERVRRNLNLEARPSDFQTEPPDQTQKRPEKPPRVFISYSRTSPEHEQWVEALGAFLRENGIDARLDIWNLRRGMDLPQFMTNELTLADRVVLVSDERYAEKADGRVGGAGWETMIVQGDIGRQPPESTKYLVVVRSRRVDDGLPRSLQTKYVIHWPTADPVTDDQNRKILLRELFDYVPIPRWGKGPCRSDSRLAPLNESVGKWIGSLVQRKMRMGTEAYVQWQAIHRV